MHGWRQGRQKVLSWLHYECPACPTSLVRLQPGRVIDVKADVDNSTHCRPQNIITSQQEGWFEAEGGTKASIEMAKELCSSTRDSWAIRYSNLSPILTKAAILSSIYSHHRPVGTPTRWHERRISAQGSWQTWIMKPHVSWSWHINSNINIDIIMTYQGIIIIINYVVHIFPLGV